MNANQYLTRCQQLVEASLSEHLPQADEIPTTLHEAMRYAVLNGGKRVRAALVYATGEALGAEPAVLNTIASAIEMIHAFSLIHDDLPAIDNDDLRRGKPTCHKVYGEAIAILAGDALHARAFEILCMLPSEYLSAKTVLTMTLFLTRAVGSQGLIGGEALDVLYTGKPPCYDTIAAMYQWKTGSLIRSAIMLGAFAADCTDRYQLLQLYKFGGHIGLMFQIQDDIIGMESTTDTLGKTQGKDAALNKSIYPDLFGMEKCKDQLRDLKAEALAFLTEAKMEGSYLAPLTDFIINRLH